MPWPLLLTQFSADFPPHNLGSFCWSRQMPGLFLLQNMNIDAGIITHYNLRISVNVNICVFMMFFESA